MPLSTEYRKRPPRPGVFFFPKDLKTHHPLGVVENFTSRGRVLLLAALGASELDLVALFSAHPDHNTPPPP